jgi:ABC-type cobalamin/Fe3+-siderophores transport system ATPase subunit
MTALSIVALAKCFHAGIPGCSASASVLSSVTLALWPGEIVALEGARGCGKSTLLRCAAGLLRPDSGSVSWIGHRTMPRECGAYLCVGAGTSNGALHAQIERAVSLGSHILLVDDLPAVGALERRLIIASLRRCAAAGASVLLAANEALACESFISRGVTLERGTLVQLRKRSAARIAASSRASRARSSARSTYGRSLRSPQ